MVKIIRPVFFTLLLCALLTACKDEDIYEPPDWLAGKVYTQVKSKPELSLFAQCIELTGYDSIIDVSGSYTVFAPNNEAIERWLIASPQYNSVEDVPIPILDELVKYHIVQNPWSRIQLMTLDVFGWIDSLDLNNDKPRGFKRETLLRKEDMVVGVTRTANRFSIIDTTKTTWRRRVLSSRKLAPVFYKQYFDIYDLSTEDYSFYFDRPFESPGDLYYAGAKILDEDMFAENGFVYTIDRVVEPLKNAYEILSSGAGYSDFLDFINQFASFNYNQNETFRQPGAAEGLKVDSLFNLAYPQLAINISSERTQAPPGSFGLPGEVSIRYHHGVVAPTNEAFGQFINEYLTGPSRWGGINNAPAHIRSIIANTHMSNNPIYASDFSEGFYNGEKDIVSIDESTIVEKSFGSNSTFLGVDRAIVPRAFSSVTGPVYLQTGYTTAMYAIQNSGLLPTLKRRNQQYTFFVESDLNLLQDSSLMYNPVNRSFITWQVPPFGGTPQAFGLSARDIRTLLLNHIGTRIPTGLARKEFIPNLAGNYLVFDNVTGEVSGPAPTTVGYMGSIAMPNYPSQIFNADNGITYDIDNWFSFEAPTILGAISSRHPHFHNLMQKAGLVLAPPVNRYTFISENQFYTVFIPTAEAIETSGANDLPAGSKALKDFILAHFIQGDVIFTDGNRLPGYYQTARVDDRSTAFNVIYTSIYIDPGYDVIRFPGSGGGDYITVNESILTNQLAGRTIQEGTGQATIPNAINQGVIHVVDKAFSLGEMVTK
jgi:uncharacterized surface protein with fasciclin (FAS1) repeats